ncbi:MAG: hypothetical protein BIFFINMI_02396 [Phycisphaerae bacterium]|nr:hypothetical protein [Phycisphaerae bacterium]
MRMIVLWVATAACLLASFVADRRRTLRALKLAGVRIGRIMPAFLVMLVLFAVGITLVPEAVVSRLLGQESGVAGVAVAAAIGSVTLMPGFIAFPLSGALLREGVPYMVLAAFTSTMMMVGVVTYPLERQYFGRGVTLIRNGLCLLIALVVTVVMGLVFKEIHW